MGWVGGRCRGGKQTCVGAGMPLELVAPCEPLATEEPVADKGPLAGVQAHVSPQQGCLTEGLAAVGDVAHVLLLALLSRPLVPVLAVGTRAGHAAPLFPRLGLSSQGLFHLQLDLGGAQPTDGQVVSRYILHSQLLLSYGKDGGRVQGEEAERCRGGSLTPVWPPAQGEVESHSG